MNYFLNKDNTRKHIYYMKYDTTKYSLNIKVKGNSSIVIKVFDPNLTVKPIVNGGDTSVNISDFEEKFKKLATIILNYLYASDDETSSGDLGILLDEVERLKCVDLLEAKKNMEIAEYNNYLEKITFLERELKQKQMMISFRESLNEDLSNFKSR